MLPAKLHRTCLYLVSIHQMAHPRLRLRTSNCSLLLIYLPRKDESELAWVAGYVMRQFTCPKAVTHPSTNRARCKATALIETNALPLHQTANISEHGWLTAILYILFTKGNQTKESKFFTVMHAHIVWHGHGTRIIGDDRFSWVNCHATCGDSAGITLLGLPSHCRRYVLCLECSYG